MDVCHLCHDSQSSDFAEAKTDESAWQYYRHCVLSFRGHSDVLARDAFVQQPPCKGHSLCQNLWPTLKPLLSCYPQRFASKRVMGWRIPETLQASVAGCCSFHSSLPAWLSNSLVTLNAGSYRPERPHNKRILETMISEIPPVLGLFQLECRIPKFHVAVRTTAWNFWPCLRRDIVVVLARQAAVVRTRREESWVHHSLDRVYII